ncbi:MAG: hypothetical protein ACR2L9_05215 [Solirubrobacteraceae bacterium]
MCHLDVVSLDGRNVECATCGARGALREDFSIEWTDLRRSVISMDEKRAHYQEIRDTARRHAALRADIEARASTYDEFDRIERP